MVILLIRIQVAAGFLGDRFQSSRVITWGFVILILSYAYFAFIDPIPSATWILISNIIIASIAIFGIRGIYFALFEEAGVPMVATGVAVGLVSVIGFTPDVFVALVAGILLDRSPGVIGHQHVYMFLGVFAVLGFAASVMFRKVKTGRVA